MLDKFCKIMAKQTYIEAGGPADRRAEVVVFVGADKVPPLELRCLDIPATLQEGQILARILMCTICGSDLHTLQGKRKEACPR